MSVLKFIFIHCPVRGFELLQRMVKAILKDLRGKKDDNDHKKNLLLIEFIFYVLQIIDFIL